MILVSNFSFSFSNQAFYPKVKALVECLCDRNYCFVFRINRNLSLDPAASSFCIVEHSWTCTFVFAYVSACVFVCISMSVCIYICVCLYESVCVCLFMYVCVYLYVCAFMR